MTSIAFPEVIRRPTSYSGVWSWIVTVDHKRIGTLYGVTAFIWFIVGGIEALIMRAQLARPEAALVSPEVYNQLFTMHGTVMIFLVVMPLTAAFFNWMVPLMIGARDVAFPRLNAFSYWTFLFGGLLLNASFLFGGAPNVGWFAYAPLTQAEFSMGHGVTFWTLGLQVLGVASIAAALNFLVTIINMRAPGMSFFKMPLFVWGTMITNILILLAFPVIGVALLQLMFDRLFGTHYFNPAAGGDPVLWQHMFWLFGHPEVYILILPAFAIVSEILPTFARKPLFGYPVIVFTLIAIAFMGWFVWGHHMFTVGMGPAVNAAFSITTMLIAVPTGVKIFNWIGTLWGGQLRFTTPMLFALGFIMMFIIGGLSGVHHSCGERIAFDVPADDEEMLIALYRKTLEAALVKMAGSGAVVVRVMASGMGHYHPVQQPAHRPVFPGRQNHVPVIWHQGKREQLDGIAFQAFPQHAEKGLVVFVLVEDRLAGISTV
jgi:cytochrome c oxidase subunit I